MIVSYIINKISYVTKMSFHNIDTREIYFITIPPYGYYIKKLPDEFVIKIDSILRDHVLVVQNVATFFHLLSRPPENITTKKKQIVKKTNIINVFHIY